MYLHSVIDSQKISLPQETCIRVRCFYGEFPICNEISAAFVFIYESDEQEHVCKAAVE
jgi:hypothetical protein